LVILSGLFRALQFIRRMRGGKNTYITSKNYSIIATYGKAMGILASKS
jgi:hypothetical protein